MPKYIIKDIEISSDSDKETSGEENSNEENSDKNTKKNSEKKHGTDIKIFLKKKKKKVVRIVRYIGKSYLSIEEILI